MLPEFEIFSGKTLNSLMEDIYKNSKKKDKQIKELIGILTPLIATPSDAAVLVPIVKDFLDVSVKNDDQLIKLATIVQRLITNMGRSGDIESNDMGISEEEKKRLLREAQDELNRLRDPSL